MPIHVTTSTVQSLSNKTFVDRLSTTNVIFASSGNSDNWSSAYTTVQANSSTWGTSSGGADAQVRALTGNWQSTYTEFSAQSANNASVFTTVQANSASWGIGGSGVDTEVRALTGNWQSTYTTVQSNSSTWSTSGSFTVEDANSIIGLSIFL